MVLLRRRRFHVVERNLLDRVSERAVLEGENDRIRFEGDGDFVSMKSHVSWYVGEEELVEG